ncbi:hypothetical protein BST61_g4843 [Cercospora zeina]
MRYSIAPVALAALAAANPVPQGVAEAISPSTSAPSGCSPDYPGTFQIQVVNVTTPAKQKRQSGTLMLTLQGGILKDAQGRTGYIADNRQFQFDAPAQTGAIYTAGWSVCQNGTLAIGSDVVFQQCLSGTFYNLYDENSAAQCSPVYIEAINGGGSAAQVQPDARLPMVSPNGFSCEPDWRWSTPTGAPVSQIGDGQIQAATSAAPVSQIADGQVQAPVSQIADGQIQAPKQTGSPVSQIPDGQIQSTNATAASPSVVPYTGAATLNTTGSRFRLSAVILLHH